MLVQLKCTLGIIYIIVGQVYALSHFDQQPGDHCSNGLFYHLCDNYN